MKVNTKTWLKLALILVSGLCLYLFLRNDAFLYQQPIGKVVAVLTVLLYEIPRWYSFLFWLDSRQYHPVK